MKFNNGFAADISNTAWMMPRIPPKNNADEAEGICRFVRSSLTILTFSLAESEL